MKRALIALLAFFLVGSASGQSPGKIRITTWNPEWFANGSPREAQRRASLVLPILATSCSNFRHFCQIAAKVPRQELLAFNL